jgi:cysteine synthase
MKNIVGNTPLVKIRENLYGKLETFNPAGSVKDRMISYVVSKAQLYGHINKNTVLCDATSGNTGISLSMAAADMGLSCIIFMPKNMSPERKQMMKIYGAKIIDAPANDFVGAIAMRDGFLSANKLAWSPMQFSNKKNVECHFLTTGPEIHKDLITMKRPWAAFVHGSGTGGTIEGIRRYVNYHKLSTKICMVCPSESPHGIQGIADGKDFLAKKEDMDSLLYVTTQDAIERSKRLATESGLLVGISSGANVLAAERWMATPEYNKNPGIVVTMLCDRGERYMSIYDKN